MAKYTNKITDRVASVLATGTFPTDNADEFKAFLDDINHDRVLAVLEYPSIDIELEAYTYNGGQEPVSATDEDNSIMLSYCVCLKGLCNGEETWMFDDFLSFGCFVDWSDPHWRVQLRGEMEDTLRHYAKLNDYSLTDLNFIED